MNIVALSPLVAFALTVPSFDASSVAPLSSPTPVVAQVELSDMRAGAARVVAPLADSMRAELLGAHDSSLADMRAGSSPTDEEWTWIGIGAVAVVLLIVLL